jgi:hypothetical protein
MDSYLWDRSGPPDPEVQELEKALAVFRYVPPPLRQRAPSDDLSPIRFPRPSRLPFVLAAAAAILLAGFFAFRARLSWRADRPWKVAAVAGNPVAGAAGIHGSGELAVGQTLETDARSRAHLQIGNIGSITVGPESRVRLLATRTRHHRIALDYGSIEAKTWAPPFSFAVETPSSSLFDLGCAFTLRVDRNGYGVVHVDAGWVQFEYGDRTSIVPAGADAITRPKLGPGTAFFRDARPEFQDALASFDNSPEGSESQARSLDRLLASARPRDALTLLNLLRQTNRRDRERVLDVLDRLLPIPEGVSRQELLELQTAALDRYWSELGLGNPKSWIMRWRDVLGS